jgi:hypothetical protein
MSNLLRKLYSPIFLDLLFAGVGIVCFIGLFQLAAVPIPPVVPPDNAAAKGAALAALVVASGLLSIYTTRFDQAMADDYMFQILTRSSLMAVMSFIFVFVLWNVLFAEALGRLASFSTLTLLLACWSVSYLINRLRGTRA